MRWFETIFEDIRLAARQLRNSPAFTLTAVAVLALGIGANAAVFTLVSSILLRPLPYAQPDRIVAIQQGGQMGNFYLPYADILQLHDAAGSRVPFAVEFGGMPASVVGTAGRFQVTNEQVSANLPAMLGVQPMLGRSFSPDEDDPGRNHVVLLSEQAWRKLYAADPAVIGKTLAIQGEPYTILGVMPRGFAFPFGAEMQIWTPAAITPANRTAMAGPDMAYGAMFVRLPDGMTTARLAAQLSNVQARIAQEQPDQGLGKGISVTGYQRSLNDDARKPLALIDAVVLGIWVLACLNVTSLMLARAVARTREQAVRAALGASRSRLLQNTLVESLLLSVTGALVGLSLGMGALKLLAHSIDRALPLANTVHLDWRVALGLALLTLITAALVGVFPAWRAMSRNVQGGLSGARATASAGQNRTREVLVVGQLALTLVFLVGAGLLLRTVNALRHVPLGFTQTNVLTGGISFNQTQRQMDAAATAKTSIVQTMYLPLIDRLKAIPGVKTAALSSVLPMRSEFMVTVRTFIDGKKMPFDQAPSGQGRLASAGLVEALGIPMLKGRFFTEADTPDAPPVAVVNQAFVNRYMQGMDPVRHSISMGEGRFAQIQIVGVIGDVKQTSVKRATEPEIYFCLAQVTPGMPLYGIATAFIQVAIRGSIPADSLRASFEKALREVAPDATTTDVKTIHEAVEDSFGSQTLTAYLLEGFAGLALLIASVGLYGLLSFTVAQRTREIGLRIALGAQRSNILGLILGRALVLVGLGLAVGTAGAWFAARLAHGYFYGVKDHDSLTFTAVALVLAAAALPAAWLPARRAALVEPMHALRLE